jgi:hypothetical protein
MSSPLLSTTNQTFQGLFPSNTIHHLPPTVTPEANLRNPSEYPSVQDMVEYALGDDSKRDELTAVWKGVIGSDHLFISAVQAYYSGIHCNHYGGSIHPLPNEFEDLINMGTVDNCDPPSAMLQQSFHYAAGLAVNLLDLLDDNSCCHEMLAAKLGVRIGG